MPDTWIKNTKKNSRYEPAKEALIILWEIWQWFYREIELTEREPKTTFDLVSVEPTEPRDMSGEKKNGREAQIAYIFITRNWWE